MTILLFRCCLLVALTAFTLFPIPLAAQSSAPSETLGGLEGLSQAFQSLTEKVTPSVVQIFTSGYEPILRADGGIAAVVARQ